MLHRIANMKKMLLHFHTHPTRHYLSSEPTSPNPDHSSVDRSRITRNAKPAIYRASVTSEWTYNETTTILLPALYYSISVSAVMGQAICSSPDLSTYRSKTAALVALTLEHYSALFQSFNTSITYQINSFAYR